MKSLHIRLAVIAVLFFAFRLSASTFYWVDGTGTWNQFNLHWATTSGGLVFYNHAPTSTDDVVFDANSFTATNQSVTLDNGTFICRSMTWSGVLFNPKIITNTPFNSTLTISGSLTNTTAMSWQYGGDILFAATTTGNTITLATGSLGRVRFTGTGGGWTLMDTLYCNELSHEAGTLRTNNFFVLAGQLFHSNSSGVKSLYLGKSRIVTQSFQVLSTQTVLHADSCIIQSDDIQSSSGRAYNRIELGYLQTGAGLVISGSTVKYILTGTGLSALSGGSNVIDSLITRGNMDLFLTNSFGYIEFRGDSKFDAANTIGKLYLNNHGRFVRFKSGTTTTLTNTIQTNSGCSGGAVTICATTSGSQATISKSSGTVSCNNILLQDIKAQGGATFTASHSGILSNVTGWTVSGLGSTTLYWVGGSGNWTDNAHWAISSGGTGGNCPPTAIDNVIFDGNSFTTTNRQVFVNQTASFNNMTWTNVHFQPRIYNTNTSEIMNVYGNFTLTTGMTWDYAGNLRFCSGSPNKTINTSRIRLTNTTVQFDSPVGSWKLLDSIRCSKLQILSGTFQSNNKLIRVTNELNYQSSTAKTAFFGTSRIDCQTWSTPVGTLALHADSSFISCQFFYGGPSYTYNRVEMSLHPTSQIIGSTCPFLADYSHFDTVIFRAQGGINYDASTFNYVLFMVSGGIQGYTNTFQKLECRNNLTVEADEIFGTLFLNNPGYTVLFPPGVTQTINQTITTAGTCSSGNITVKSGTSGTQAIISKTSGTIACSNLVLQDINATGGATFNAYNSVNAGNVTGWAISGSSARTLYWVGGTGNWTATSHWSNTSGGTGGACTPAPSDNVIFDANSFTGNDTVKVDHAAASCRNMTWQSMSVNPVVINTHPHAVNQPGDINIYGSIQLNNQVQWNYDGNLNFTGSARGNTIDMKGNVLADVLFNGLGASWTLLDSLNTMDIKLNHGTLNTNGYKVNNYDLFQVNGDTLRLGASFITTQFWENYLNATMFNAGSSLVNASWFQTTGQAYNDLDMDVVMFPPVFYSSNCTFNHARFSADGIGFYNCQNNSFQDAVFNGSAGITGVTSFGRAEFRDDVNFTGAASFDTLYLNNPGKTVLLKNSATYTINDVLITNGQAGSPIIIKSLVAGVQANISKTSDTICVDYLSLQDIHATGGAAFYSGFNSIDMGNNSGWTFTSCNLPYNDVWPGDVNNDLVVDNLDALYIGIAYGTSSYTRSSASLSWTAQPCLEWPYVYTNLVNVNNADCDGNGVVDSLDLAGVVLNYGMTRPPMAPPLRLQQLPLVAGVPLFFQPSTVYYHAGDTVSIPVMLGNAASQVTNAYGLACHIEYDGSRIVNGSVDMSLGSSWLTPQANRLEFIYSNQQQARVEFSDSRIDQQNVSGNGQIGTISFIIDTSATDSIQLFFSNIHLLDVDQNPLAVSAQPISLYIVAPPVANFSASPTTVCPGGTVTFSDLSTGSPTSWSWTFPGGSPATSTAQNPTVTYNTPGTYAVSLTVTGASGNDTHSIPGYIIVNTLPNVTTTSTPSNGIICTGSSATLTGGGAASYTWSGGITDGVAFTPVSTQTYTVTGTDGNGCQDTATATLTVITPSVSVTSNPSNGIVCSGNAATLTASGTVSYNWTGGITNGVAFTPSATQTYTVTGTDSNGCQATAQATITVDAPSISITSNPSNGIVCSGNPATLTASGAVSYSWTGGITNGVAFTSSTTQTYTVTGTDNDGCQATAQATITVDAPNISVTSNPSNGIVCPGSQVTLTASGAVSYSWTGGITNGVAFTPSATQTYTVTGTDGNGCQGTAQATITVSPCAVSTVPCGNTYNKTNVSVSAANVPGAISYRFSFYDNSTGALITQFAQASRTLQLSSVPGLYYATTYKWTVAVNTGIGFGPESSSGCTITFGIPTTTVTCGAAFNSLSAYTTVPVTGWAVNYRFSFYDNSTGALVMQRTQSSNYIYFNQVPGLNYGTTYKWTVAVEYALSSGGTTFGPESSMSCTITFNAPTTTVPCGVSYNSMNTYTTVPDPGNAINYRFSFYNNSTGALVAQRTQASNYIYFNQVTGLNYGTTYKWTVAVEYALSGGGSAFGPESSMNCTITFNAPKTTVPCGNLYNLSTGYTTCASVPNATGYRFTFFQGSTQVAQRAQTSNYIYFNQVTGLQNNQSYTWMVEVQYNNGSGLVYGPPSTACSIGFGNPTSRMAAENDAGPAISVYPNPTSGHITIDISERIDNIHLYTVTGDLVGTYGEVYELNISDLAPGTYFMLIQTESGIKRNTIIKE